MRWMPFRKRCTPHSPPRSWQCKNIQEWDRHVLAAFEKNMKRTRYRWRCKIVVLAGFYVKKCLFKYVKMTLKLIIHEPASETIDSIYKSFRKDYRIGTLRYYWPMSAHASQAFSTLTVPIRKIYHLHLIAYWILLEQIIILCITRWSTDQAYYVACRPISLRRVQRWWPCY